MATERPRGDLHLLLDPLSPAMRIFNLLPKGRSLPEHVWIRRHRGLLLLLWVHVAGLAALGAVRGYGPIHIGAEVGILLLFAVLGSMARAARRLRAFMVAFGLLSSSALLVHLTGGLIESHFHFFVVVPLLTLYGDWSVFLLAIAFVALHHGVLAQWDPQAVFNHPAAWRQPWKWALVHAAYILGASGTALIAWRATEERALRDSLTQLANAESFFEQAHRARARARRRRERFAVLYIDLDGFKQVNDVLGHSAGDQVLVSVGDRLRVSLRDSDIAARLGGDEFAVLLEDVPTRDAGEAVASRVLHALGEPFILKGRSVSISASGGLAVSDSEGDKVPEELVKEADEAMYRAKRLGKGHHGMSPETSLVVAT
jgi:diguanylate cyclase (GGDEF)-like protein